MRTTLRVRFALAFAVVAAVVAGTVGVLSFHAASERIFQEIDTSLRSATVALADGQSDVLNAPPPPGPGGRREQPRPMVAQIVAPDGTVTPLGSSGGGLPVTPAVRRLAASGTVGQTDLDEIDMPDGGPSGQDPGPHLEYRILSTVLDGDRGVLQVGVDVEETEHVLGGMANEIALASTAVLVIAAAAGWLLARRITRRLEGVTRFAEDVSRHGGIDQRVPVDGDDEVGRLATSFNTMLGRLTAARDAQERLVQDAAHELRTPLTSLRTNASVLHRIGDLSPEARRRLVEDVQGETRELSHLVDELVELALARRADEAEQPVDLAELAHTTADRVARRTRRRVEVDADRSVVRGLRQGLDRAVGNLLENAVKFDGDTDGDINGGAEEQGREPVRIHVRDGRVTVTDRGPGIDPADAERIFDRFYRADRARGLPGSGLGLSIVHDVARAHGGSVFAGTRPGGGAAVGFTVDPARLLPGSHPHFDGGSPATTNLETGTPSER